MRKKFDYRFDKGLPGGANQVKGRVKGSVTQTGYKRNSPDVDNDFNIIPSPYITMVGVDFPVYGEDNLGNGQMMYPGNEYIFPGDYVTELPAYGDGGLKQWFAEKWVDIKTGKKCGRSGKDKKGRPYPACRPSRRVNKSTPKTVGELSSAEKARFKREKTSGERIHYNHTAQDGIETVAGYNDRYGNYVAPGDTLYSGPANQDLLYRKMTQASQNSRPFIGDTQTSPDGTTTVRQGELGFPQAQKAEFSMYTNDDKGYVIYTPEGYEMPKKKSTKKDNPFYDLLKSGQESVKNIRNRFQEGGVLPKAQGGIYTVQKGDTFNQIARSTGIGQDALRLANPGINYDRIQVGQTLVAPGLTGPELPPSDVQSEKDKKKKKQEALSFNDLLYRQAYQESKFNPNAKSPKGYKGFTQIGSGIMQDYAKATGDTRTNPYDPDYAIAVQKWAMDKYLNKTGWIKGSDKVKQAKALAAYNWGPGNTLKYLNAQKDKGTDIYSEDLSWTKGMPKETRDYIDHILGLDYSTKDKWESNFQRDTTDSPYSKYYKQQGGETLYDYVKGLGYSPTFANRKKIFADYFDTEYTGTAKQNIELLNQLKSGQLNINEYAQRAEVQPITEPVIQQPLVEPAVTVQEPVVSNEQPVVANLAAPETVMNPTPQPEVAVDPVNNYRGSRSMVTDDDLSDIRNSVVSKAYDVIEGKRQPYNLPSNVANAESMKGKDPRNFTCIGGVCTFYEEEGVLDKNITSNTEFARVAQNNGFSRKSSRLENLKPGDVLQHSGNLNATGTPIPSHAQMYLGRDDNGNYLFFDNYERTSTKSTPDGSKDGLRVYSPQKMEEFISKGKENRKNGAFIYHLNKEDAYDPEEQVKRARAQANKERRLPGELYIDEQYDGKEYDEEIQSSQDIPYIYRGKEGANKFEKELVGLFNSSDMDERLKSTFGITEQTLNEIKPFVYGIMAQESNMGSGSKFTTDSSVKQDLGKLARTAKYKGESLIAPSGIKDLSYGPGSVRWSGLRKSAKKQIGKRRNLNNPEGAYFAVVDMLLQKANQAERYVGEDLNADLLDQNPWYPALYAYSGQMLGQESTLFGQPIKGGKRWGMVTGRNSQGEKYSADRGSYPQKVQAYADELQRFIPIDYEPTIDNYYDPRFVPVVKPKGK